MTSLYRPAALVAIDTEGRVIALNQQAEQLLATDTTRAVGRTYNEVFGPSLAARMLPLYLRSAQNASFGAPELLGVTLPDGRRVTLRASIGPLRNDSHETVGLLFVTDEVSEAPATADAVTQRLRQALHRYLGDSVASMVEERPSFVAVGGARRHVSVLHADVRNYTGVAERLSPEDTVAMLVRYHGSAVEALTREGATLDRFIGDSVLAMWNAPEPFALHARAAIRAGLALQHAATSVGADLAYGVGIHTGDAVVGNLGNERYANYTAVGDTVNIAARLQAEAAPGEVICSESSLAEAGEGIEKVSLGLLQIRGRSHGVEAYRVISVVEKES